MTTIDRSIELSTGFPAVETTAGADAQLVSTAADFHKRQWAIWLDDYLIEWGQRPELVADGELRPPTQAALSAACRIAMEWADNTPAPHRIIPDGEGGLVFEWRSDNRFVSAEITATGSCEFLTFDDGRLIARCPFAQI